MDPIAIKALKMNSEEGLTPQPEQMGTKACSVNACMHAHPHLEYSRLIVIVTPIPRSIIFVCH